MEKVDLKKQLKQLYGPRAGRMEVVEVPELAFLMVDGRGRPEESEEFRAAIPALYTTAYTLKFMLKGRSDPGLPDFTIMPLEGLWPSDVLSEGREGDWEWTLMLLQPDFVTPALVTEALEEARRKKPVAGLERVRLERLREGTCVQVLYMGPYDAERPAIEALHGFAAALGLRPRGRHHEIYLSDPNRTAPERLKTVLRQPVEPAA
jgi:hypothetical protein